MAVSTITDGEAGAAGFPRLDDLLQALEQGGHGTAYRIALRYAGADPRIALRDQIPNVTLYSKTSRRDSRGGTL